MKVASGFAGLQATALAQIAFSKYVILRGAAEDFIDEIVNDKWDQNIFDVNAVVKFMTEPQVGEWHAYSSTQVLVADEVTVSYETMTICNAVYKAISVSDDDVALMSDVNTVFTASFVTKFWESLQRRFRCFVLSGLLQGAKFFGKNTGPSRLINLGTDGDPVILTGDKVYTIFTAARRAFVESKRWSDRPNDMYAIITPAMQEAILNSTYFLNRNFAGSDNEGILISGEMPGKILGFRIFVTNDLPPASGGGHRIIFGHRDAFLFYRNVIRSRVVAPTDRFTHEYQALAIFDGKTIWPDALAVAVVRVEG